MFILRALFSTAAAVALLAGSAVAANAGAASTTLRSETVRVLQMNLCNSGQAGCYKQGRAVGEAIEKMKAHKSKVVTFNEICRDDFAKFLKAEGDIWGHAKGHFRAAGTANGGTIACKNGGDYGIGVVQEGNAAIKTWDGQFRDQSAKNEKRVYSCMYAPSGYYACTAHLDSSDEKIALAQCKQLMFDIVPTIRAKVGVDVPFFVGGDFNLEYDKNDKENVQNCVPNGYVRKGDGGVQHIIGSNNARFTGASTFGMNETDHSALVGTFEIG